MMRWLAGRLRGAQRLRRADGKDGATGQPAPIPRTIWMLWLQGLQDAPPVVAASLASWRAMNPGYTVRMLCRQTLAEVIPGPALSRIFAATRPPQTYSDEIRLELLIRHGGVWADATTLCLRPLDTWLADHAPQGFFAFDRPGPDRMLSTWFLAANRQNPIAETWLRACLAYWQGRDESDHYFWFQDCFASCYAEDAAFRAAWDATPKVSARHLLHFGPNSATLTLPMTDRYLAALRDPAASVIKLTHKMSPWPGPESLMSRLIGHSARNWQDL